MKPEKAGNSDKGSAKAKPEKTASKPKKAKAPSDKTRKIAAATKAKRAAKSRLHPSSLSLLSVYRYPCQNIWQGKISNKPTQTHHGLK